MKRSELIAALRTDFPWISVERMNDLLDEMIHDVGRYRTVFECAGLLVKELEKKYSNQAV